MPTRALELRINLQINSVTCPGVWLKDAGNVVVRIHVLGQSIQTMEVIPRFPIMINETFSFNKKCSDPGHVAELLSYEDVIIELVQSQNGIIDMRYHENNKIIGYFVGDLRTFLYPKPVLRPSYSSGTSYVLLEPSVYFLGSIRPKLEFSTKTAIRESKYAYVTEEVPRIPSHSCFEKLVKDGRIRSRAHKLAKESCRKESARVIIGSPFLLEKIDDLWRFAEEFVLDGNGKVYPLCFHRGRGVNLSNGSFVGRRINRCVVCRLYQEYFGRPYTGHRHVDGAKELGCGE